ncbi:outer membrane protein assembly factor BamD [Caldimonas taiwanensis]|uniref:outer membrane protein assembly factor BamD n=1 Tax=Caldimonas taiwanensis TaxID=307483 RepID=UPI0007810179|nr:outer membrane protein assembly factor BamD [Caldimonas taiwanensis]
MHTPFALLGRRGALALACAALLTACSSTPKDETAGMSVERVYSEARADAAAGNYERAIRLYERLEGRAAGSLLAQQALLELAHTYYRSGERAQALATIERYMKLYPASPASDYALYLKGLINFNDNLGLFGRFSRQSLSERDQQASKEAYQAFRQLVELYPESVYAADAQARMNFIVNSLAQYEVHVARYYFRRGAYLAAANRAQLAVREYQLSPAVEEALYLMAQSYDRLGLPQLRDDALRVLQRNFPQSIYLGQAGMPRMN